MKITLKELYDFNQETNFVNDGHIKVNTKYGLKKIEGVQITQKNSKKLNIKTTNFNIIVSPEHLLYNHKWIKSNLLKINDFIDTINGYEKIINITNDDILEDLYDIQVENEEFYANNIRSHNSALQESIDFSIFGVVRGKEKKKLPLKDLPNRINKNLLNIINFKNDNGDDIYIERGLEPQKLIIKVNDNDITNKYKFENIESIYEFECSTNKYIQLIFFDLAYADSIGNLFRFGVFCI